MTFCRYLLKYITIGGKINHESRYTELILLKKQLAGIPHYPLSVAEAPSGFEKNRNIP